MNVKNLKYARSEIMIGENQKNIKSYISFKFLHFYLPFFYDISTWKTNFINTN